MFPNWPSFGGFLWELQKRYLPAIQSLLPSAEALWLELVTLPLFVFIFNCKRMYFLSLILQNSWAVFITVFPKSTSKQLAGMFYLKFDIIWTTENRIFKHRKSFRMPPFPSPRLRTFINPLSGLFTHPSLLVCFAATPNLGCLLLWKRPQQCICP